nr:MAG TPA_asm: hypothetical protein [Bacteriophage sp.]
MRSSARTSGASQSWTPSPDGQQNATAESGNRRRQWEENTMREAEGYRPQLELLTDMFPGRAAITVNE